VSQEPEQQWIQQYMKESFSEQKKSRRWGIVFKLLTFTYLFVALIMFLNIGGLKQGAAVKSAGVVVGRVDSIQFDGESFQAKVSLALQNQYDFPKDSSLKILTSGLLGEQYVGIVAGADEKNLVAGDNIGSTQSAVVLENLISQFLYSKAADPAAPPSGSK